MGLIAKYSQQAPGKAKMSREQLIGLIASDAKFMDERESIADYVRSLEAGKKLDEKAVREGYQRFKAERNAKELAGVADKHGLPADTLQGFIDTVLGRMVFDGEQLTDLLAPLELELARSPGKGTGPHGRPAPPPEEARQGPRDFGTQRLRTVMGTP